MKKFILNSTSELFFYSLTCSYSRGEFQLVCYNIRENMLCDMTEATSVGALERVLDTVSQREFVQKSLCLSDKADKVSNLEWINETWYPFWERYSPGLKPSVHRYVRMLHKNIIAVVAIFQNDSMIFISLLCYSLRSSVSALTESRILLLQFDTDNFC